VNTRDFNRNKSYHFAHYARTSISIQSQGSLDRQLAAIDEVIAREKRSWQCVATFCDVGQFGRDMK
jgi:hypothetical protein